MDSKYPIDILFFIRQFRAGHDVDALIEAFTCGNCYHFALILSTLFPGGWIVYDTLLGHFMYLYDGDYFDITGRVTVADVQSIQPFEHIRQSDPMYYERLVNDCIYKVG